jgi:hypothetical protein
MTQSLFSMLGEGVHVMGWESGITGIGVLCQRKEKAGRAG